MTSDAVKELNRIERELNAKRQSEQLTPYSFRHRYAKGMHAANIPIANISEVMGHTIEVHLKSYARFKPNTTEDLVAAFNTSCLSQTFPSAKTNQISGVAAVSPDSAAAVVSIWCQITLQSLAHQGQR